MPTPEAVPEKDPGPADVVANAMKDTEAKLVAVASQRRQSADAFTDKQADHHPQSSAPSCPRDSEFHCIDRRSGRSAARASMRVGEQTQGLLDAVWDQLTKI